MLRLTVRIRPGTRRSQVVQLIRDLPAVLSGKKPDRHWLTRTFVANLGYHWFWKVRSAYLIKMDGGTDDAGIKWKPLAASTIAARNRKLLGRSRNLTPGGRIRARDLDRLSKFYLLSRLVPIMVNSGDLLRSVSPGQVGPRGGYSKPRQQIFEIRGNRTIFGSAVPYAKHAHKQRPIWPTGRRRHPWIMFALTKARDALAYRLAEIQL